ncbi:hypothetical protein AAHA92_33403 [Salvia divinorum]|uniref:Uncharacterized protein n=1 Tax=Salvia divinorum TaxID=28513 RepID=A0ABD1FR81_SALDI
MKRDFFVEKHLDILHSRIEILLRVSYEWIKGYDFNRRGWTGLLALLGSKNDAAEASSPTWWRPASSAFFAKSEFRTFGQSGGWQWHAFSKCISISGVSPKSV